MTLDLDAGDLLAELVRALETRPELASRLRAVLAPPSATVEPLYMRVGEYATRAGVSRRTGWAWVAAGLPTVGSGRTRRVDVRRADEWLRSRVQPDDALEQRARRDADRAARRAIG